MRRVNKITKTTNNHFLNMYELDMKSDEGKHSKYFVASRAENIEDLKINTRQNKADGVVIYSVYRDEKTQEEKLVLIRQYRCPIDDYIYEFPALPEPVDKQTAVAPTVSAVLHMANGLTIDLCDNVSTEFMQKILGVLCYVK